MQFSKSVVVGVLITLYLSTDSWCHYIPEKKISTGTKKNKTSSRSGRIQICGNALTTLIIEACDGIVGSLNQVSSNRDSVQTKITEDCCDQECSLDYLQNYCGETPLFALKNTLPGKTLQENLLNNLSRHPPTRPGPKVNVVNEDKNKGISEVRVGKKKHLKRNWGKIRKKRKRSFKRKCAYKSFGHYLLKLQREDSVRNNMAKVHNNINRTWPSIQIGTVSPEIDKFGGQPIVVVKKNKSNSV